MDDAGGAAVGAAGEQQYSLRWNDFHSAMVSSFRRLRDEQDFVDVTLACAGATFSAHKVRFELFHLTSLVITGSHELFPPISLISKWIGHILFRVWVLIKIQYSEE